MFEIFGIEMSIGWYIVVFTICQLINVALNTAKTIIMHKEEKVSSAIINAITYGFYAIIVVMTASALPLWITIVISALTNLIGVYGSMWVLEKFKKDSVWEITATVIATKEDIQEKIGDELFDNAIGYTCQETVGGAEYIFNIYSYSQKDSVIIKEILDRYNAKYIVHEERVKL